MKTIQIVTEDVSEEQIQRYIDRMTKGWKLFLVEPSDVTYKFINLFWGFPWDGTHETLRDLMINKVKIEGVRKHAIWIFKWNGEDRFAWCSWTKQVYDFDTKKYYQLEGDKMAMKITSIINNIMRDPDVEEIY